MGTLLGIEIAIYVIAFICLIVGTIVNFANDSPALHIISSVVLILFGSLIVGTNYAKMEKAWNNRVCVVCGEAKYKQVSVAVGPRDDAISFQCPNCGHVEYFPEGFVKSHIKGYVDEGTWKLRHNNMKGYDYEDAPFWNDDE